MQVTATYFGWSYQMMSATIHIKLFPLEFLRPLVSPKLLFSLPTATIFQKKLTRLIYLSSIFKFNRSYWNAIKSSTIQDRLELNPQKISRNSNLSNEINHVARFFNRGYRIHQNLNIQRDETRISTHNAITWSKRKTKRIILSKFNAEDQRARAIISMQTQRFINIAHENTHTQSTIVTIIHEINRQVKQEKLIYENNTRAAVGKKKTR